MEDINRIIEHKLQSSWGSQPRREGVLHSLIRKVRDDDWPPGKGWIPVLECLAAHPSEALVLDGRGRTALMAVCAKAQHAPKVVVKTVLDATKFGMETARDKTGYTALLIALDVGAPVESVELLLSKNKQEQICTPNHQGNLPIHMVLHRTIRRTVVADEEEKRLQMVDLLLSQGAEQQLLCENHRGQTPLHVAVEHRMVAALIQRLVTACSQAVSRYAAGYTPLMMAIREDAPMSVLSLLVQTDPSTTRMRDQDGRYPLRRALDSRNYRPELIDLLASCPEAVEQTDMLGRNCLSVVLEHWAAQPSLLQPEIVRILLRAAPRAAADETATTPSGRRISACPTKICYHQYKEACLTLKHSSHSTARQQHWHNVMDKWWEVLLLVVQSSIIDENVSILAAAMAASAPLVVIARILEEMPELTQLRDPNGRLPLHVACSLRGRDKEDLVCTILRSNPAMAACCDRDLRYPLMLAAEYGDVSARLLNEMIFAFPIAVSTIDRKYNLYPFQVASTVHERIESSSRIDMIFELLVASPDLLREKGLP